jgi:hypothetical protein
MFKVVSRGIIVAVIFVALIGQTMALSIATPCESSLDAQHANVSERIKHTDLASIGTELSTHCCDADCCDLDCICIANACSSIAYLPAFFGLPSAFILTELVFIPPSEQPNSFATLLYRPPIFA